MTIVSRPNKDSLIKAIDIYTDAMRPFIVRNLKTVRGARVDDLVERSLRDDQVRHFRQAMRKNQNNVEASIDFAYFPRIVMQYWLEVFALQFDHNLSARNVMWQIKDARDAAAHPPSTSDMDYDLVNARLYDISDMLGRIRNQDAKSAVERIKEQLSNPYPSPIPSNPDPVIPIKPDRPKPRLPLPAESRVLVVAAKRAWPTYNRFSIYRCQPRRSFQPSSHIAFYTAGEIKPYIPKIESVIESIDMTQREDIEKLDGRQRNLAEELHKKVERENWLSEFGGQHKWMFLSGFDDAETVKLSNPVANDKKNKNGNPTAFTQSHTYADLESLKKARWTSEL